MSGEFLAEQRSTTHVAHIIGSLDILNPAARYLKLLVSALRAEGVRSTVYTTGEGLLDVDCEVNSASGQGEVDQRASQIAAGIRDAGIEVAFYLGSPMEHIVARTASLRPAPIQVSVDDCSPGRSDVFQARIHSFETAVRATPTLQRIEHIPPASDVEIRLKQMQPATRKDLGIDGATTVSATFGDLQKLSGDAYLHSIGEVLTRFPGHFHLFAGPGNVKTLRSYLHSEGVLPRVRFLGAVCEVAPLLPMIDVYLAGFPEAGADAILDAMGAGKPVVVMQSSPESELVRTRQVTASGAGEYIMITDRLLRNPEFRAAQARALHDRFLAEFRPERLGARYRAFIESFERSVL